MYNDWTHPWIERMVKVLSMGQLQFMDALVSAIIMIYAQVLFECIDSAIAIYTEYAHDLNLLEPKESCLSRLGSNPVVHSSSPAVYCSSQVVHSSSPVLHSIGPVVHSSPPN